MNIFRRVRHHRAWDALGAGKHHLFIIIILLNLTLGSFQVNVYHNVVVSDSLLCSLPSLTICHHRSEAHRSHQCPPVNVTLVILGQRGSDWPQMGRIRGFFRTDSVHFGAVRQNVLNLI